MAFLFKLTHAQEMRGQQCFNIYHFLDISGQGSCRSLADLFAQHKAPAVASIQGAVVNHQYVQVEEMQGLIEPHTEFLVGLAGGRTGQTLPPHDAYGLTLTVATAATRSGAKRIVGIHEDDQQQGTITDIWKAIIDAVAQILAAYVADAITEYLPVIISEVTDGWTVNPIMGGNYLRITTQNSRKYYTNSGNTSLLGRGTVGTQEVDPFDFNLLPPIADPLGYMVDGKDWDTIKTGVHLVRQELQPLLL